MSEAAANLAVAAAVLLAGLSLVQLVVGLVSWSRLRQGRLAWVSAAFAALLAQGLYLARLSYDARADIAAGAYELPAVSLLGLAAAACLYFAVLKR